MWYLKFMGRGKIAFFPQKFSTYKAAAEFLRVNRSSLWDRYSDYQVADIVNSDYDPWKKGQKSIMDLRSPVKNIYVIGSLRNADIKKLAVDLRGIHNGFYSVFDDWFSAGPRADDEWLEHQKFKGNSMKQALAGPAAQHVCAFDKKHLDMADVVVLAMPAGKSGHLEAGYAKGTGKKVYVVFDKEPERWDVMYNLLDGVFENKEELYAQLKADAEAYDAEPRLYVASVTDDSGTRSYEDWIKRCRENTLGR